MNSWVDHLFNCQQEISLHSLPVLMYGNLTRVTNWKRKIDKLRLNVPTSSRTAPNVFNIDLFKFEQFAMSQSNGNIPLVSELYF